MEFVTRNRVCYLRTYLRSVSRHIIAEGTLQECSCRHRRALYNIVGRRKWIFVRLSGRIHSHDQTCMLRGLFIASWRLFAEHRAHCSGPTVMPFAVVPYGVHWRNISRYASPCLWNQLSLSFRQPDSGSSSISDSPIPSTVTSAFSNSPLCTSIAPSIIHSQLKTYLFHKSYHRSFTFPPGLPSRTIARAVSSELFAFCF